MIYINKDSFCLTHIDNSYKSVYNKLIINHWLKVNNNF